MSIAHAQNVKYAKCMRWLFYPSKERCWTHTKDVYTYKFALSYVHRVKYADTRVENRQDRKILGRQGKMHVLTCTRTYEHRITYADTHVETCRQILGQDALPTKSIESYENNSTPSSYNYSDRGKGAGK